MGGVGAWYLLTTAAGDSTQCCVERLVAVTVCCIYIEYPATVEAETPWVIGCSWTRRDGCDPSGDCASPSRFAHCAIVPGEAWCPDVRRTLPAVRRAVADAGGTLLEASRPHAECQAVHEDMVTPVASY